MAGYIARRPTDCLLRTLHPTIHDQMNHRWDFLTVMDYLRKAPPYKIVNSGDVLNYDM